MPDDAQVDPGQTIAALRRERDALAAERDEALAQQAAISEIVQIINRSPGDLAPVFDAILEKAMHLCEAAFGTLASGGGEQFHIVAQRGVPAKLAEYLRKPYRAVPGTAMGQFSGGEEFLNVTDLNADPGSLLGTPRRRAYAELGGARSILSVPLRKDGTLLGALAVYRQEVRPFTDKQIALLQNFAAQAVIAMENARLITETREALSQQTATAEVLGVINSSPGDLAPVFDALLDKGVRLCEAAFGLLMTYDGEVFRTVALHGVPPAYADFLREPIRPAPLNGLGRLLRGERLIHMADIVDDEAYRSGDPLRVATVDLGGSRTHLVVPLIKDDALLGAIVAYRQEIRPFSDKQIALLQNFAAQAVIAMENARLLTETRQALEQQTATAEVLQVINSSPGDLTPVFDAMLVKAMRLCDAAFGVLNIHDGEAFRLAAHRGLPQPYHEHLKTGEPHSPGGAHARLTGGADFVHLLDAKDDAAYPAVPSRRALVDLGGARTVLAVPLRKDGILLGSFALYRQEVRPFTDKQIRLLQNFAAQAVIAMENARLITETREALEQQTATAEVLQVINSSPGDLAPVFDAMLERARRLCEPAFGVMLTWDGERFHRVAWRGASPEVIEATREPVIGPPRSPGYRIAHGEDVVSIADLAENEATRHAPAMRTWVRLGVHSYVAVALRQEERLLGAIVIYRLEVRPFTDKEIALLQNFAAQAVIAIENARLLGELRERTHDLEESLEYQTATSDVLKVISRSTFDLQPVLQTVLDTAVRLCRAGPSEIFRMEGDGYRFAVGHGMTPEYEALERKVVIHPDPGTLVGRTAVERRVVHVLDAWTDPLYSQKEEARIGNFHTMLGVPLMREGEVAGVIALSRRLVEPFSEREIQLVTTFADQAVIAIENTRLITETREALEQQTATAEVLQVINASPGDLAPVFDAMLEKAIRLCEAVEGVLWTIDGERGHLAAAQGLPAEFVALLRERAETGANPALQRIMRGERLIHFLDMTEHQLYRSGDPLGKAAVAAGVRTLVWVALVREGIPVGAFAIGRREVQPFSDKQIALLESFAAQAVIAMDNARLLDEIRQRQAELRVTFDNMGDGVAMFDSDQRLAAWNLNFQRILELPDPLLAERPRVADFVRYLAAHGEYGAVDVEAEVRRLSERVGTQWSNERTRPDGRVIEVRSNPVPGGGVVLIYSDVTERKRAEAEIRAARDTAERALQELQTAQASLLHAQKMAALGQLTAGIAHEIKNPLNFVNNFAEISGELLQELRETTAPVAAALDDDTRAEVDEIVEMLRGNLAKIAEHGKRADGIVKSMLEHSRGVSGERRAVDLNGLIDEALNLAYHGARAQDASFNITLEREFDQGLAPIDLAPQEMMRVFLNLFGNGFYATTKRQRDGAGPDFRPTLKVTTRDLGEAVEVRVRDNGTGIPPEIRDKLFQPFVTTKPTGEGTGLGLSIAYDIVAQQHGGTITVDSVPGEFTEFTIRLPRSR